VYCNEDVLVSVNYCSLFPLQYDSFFVLVLVNSSVIFACWKGAVLQQLCIHSINTV
jgi:hypothetical protein